MNVRTSKKTILPICLLLILHFFASSTAAIAQANAWQWAQQIGGNDTDFGNAICADAQGNSYVTGSFSGTLTLGNQTFISNGGADLFLVKYGPTGQVLWAKAGGGPAHDAGNGLALDAAGNVYLIGNFQYSLILDSDTLINPGFSDILIAKFDSDGNLAWARQEGGGHWDYGNAITVDGNNTIYIASQFQEATEIGGFSFFANPSSTNMIVARLNPQGVVEWVQPLITTNMFHNCIGKAIATDAAGNLFVSGTLEGAGNIDGTFIAGNNYFTGAGTNFLTTHLLAKFSPNGSLAWIVKPQVTNNSYNFAGGLATDNQGNAYISGYFSGNLTHGTTTLTSAGGYDILLAKYAPDGTPGWAVQAGGPANEQANALALHAQGELYVTGHFSNTLTFGPGTLTANGGGDVFLAQYNLSGNPGNALAGGSGAFDTGISVAVNQGQVFVTGFANGNTTFGAINGTSHGAEDIFVARTGLISGVRTEEATLLHTTAYPNPFARAFRVELAQNQTARVGIFDMLGREVWVEMEQPTEAGILEISPDVALPNGIYLVKIEQGHVIYMVRLLKNE